MIIVGKVIRHYCTIGFNIISQATERALILLLTCGGPKKSPRTSSIVQVIFSF